MQFINSEYSTWTLVVQFGIFALMLLIANIIRRRIKLFRNLLLPTAIIAGFLGLGVKYLISGFNITIDGELILTNNFVEMITYHTIALGFVAMGLKTPEKVEGKPKGKPFKTGLLIVNTYLLQGIVGILITVVMALLFTKVAPYSGLLLPMGYGQGPGQAANIGGLFEERGFNGGKTFGLAIATFGILWACVAGVFYINRRAKEGKLSRATEEKAIAVTSENIVGVPRLTRTPSATRATSAASSGVSTIAGEAPAASRALAVNWVTTVLVRHCTRGVVRLRWSRRVAVMRRSLR